MAPLISVTHKALGIKGCLGMIWFFELIDIVNMNYGDWAFLSSSSPSSSMGSSSSGGPVSRRSWATGSPRRAVAHLLRPVDVPPVRWRHRLRPRHRRHHQRGLLDCQFLCPPSSTACGAIVNLSYCPIAFRGGLGARISVKVLNFCKDFEVAGRHHQLHARFKILNVMGYAIAFGFFKFVNYAMFFWLPYFLHDPLRMESANIILDQDSVGMMPCGVVVWWVSDINRCIWRNVRHRRLHGLPRAPDWFFALFSGTMNPIWNPQVLCVMGILVGTKKNMAKARRSRS